MLLQNRHCLPTRQIARSACVRPSFRCSAAPNGSDPQPVPQPEQKVAEGSSEASKQEVEQYLRATLPKSGYFALADTNATVYTKAGKSFNPTQKAGRYDPEFIWNTNWQETLKREESMARQAEREALEEKTTEKAGTISFSRLADLNSMDVDLSEVLNRKRSSTTASTSAATPTTSQPARKPASSGSGQQKVVPLPRNDIKRMERFNRVSPSMTVTAVSNKPEDEALKAKIAEEERVRYEAQKSEQRLWTSVLALVGTGVAYNLYSREVAISYALGAVGGIIYLRLLGKSVDGLGATDGAGAAGSLAAQPRLLIPVILAPFYNRWNMLYADEYDIHLNLFGILVGFLMYKVAVIGQGSRVALDELSKSLQKKSD